MAQRVGSGGNEQASPGPVACATVAAIAVGVRVHRMTGADTQRTGHAARPTGTGTRAVAAVSVHAHPGNTLPCRRTGRSCGLLDQARTAGAVVTADAVCILAAGVATPRRAAHIGITPREGRAAPGIGEGISLSALRWNAAQIVGTSRSGVVAVFGTLRQTPDTLGIVPAPGILGFPIDELSPGTQPPAAAGAQRPCLLEGHQPRAGSGVAANQRISMGIGPPQRCATLGRAETGSIAIAEPR